MKKQKDPLYIEQNLDAEQIADFFRALADVIAGGCESCLQQYGINMTDFRKIKVGLKKGKGQELSLKIKVKETLPATSPQTEKRNADTDYQLLKKKMKQTFTRLSSSLAKGTLPPEELVEVFLADSVTMVSFPGYGDEYYEKYALLCQNFQEAYQKKDINRVKEGFQQLALCKKACHARFK